MRGWHVPGPGLLPPPSTDGEDDLLDMLSIYAILLYKEYSRWRLAVSYAAKNGTETQHWRFSAPLVSPLLGAAAADHQGTAAHYT